MGYLGSVKALFFSFWAVAKFMLFIYDYNSAHFFPLCLLSFVVVNLLRISLCPISHSPDFDSFLISHFSSRFLIDLGVHLSSSLFLSGRVLLPVSASFSPVQ